MKNNCWLCGGTRDHFEMWDLAMGDRIIYFGFSCLNDILTQHVLDFESKDKAMSERANRHEAESNEEPETIHLRDCRCYSCERKIRN